MKPVQVRWMIRRDTPEVLRCEFECYAHPLTEAELLGELRQRNVIAMVYDDGRDVLGYMLYELHKGRLQILRFAVLPSFQRSGIGRAMVERLVGKLTPNHRTAIEVTCSERVTDGHLFLRACGFTAIGVERDYFKRGHDGYRFRYSLVEAEPVPAFARGEVS